MSFYALYKNYAKKLYIFSIIHLNTAIQDTIWNVITIAAKSNVQVHIALLMGGVNKPVRWWVVSNGVMFYQISLHRIYGYKAEKGHTDLHTESMIIWSVSFLSLGKKKKAKNCNLNIIKAKRQRREADHSPPTSIKIKKSGAIPPPSNTSS
jgi:hypothetical protein